MKRLIVSTIILLFAPQISRPVFSPVAQPSIASSCSSAEYRQFDFWLGDWDSLDFGTTAKNARIHVTPILGGCALLEDYHGLDGHEGKSLSMYDATRKLWHQTWVTNNGRLLVIEGSFRAGAMTLFGSDLTPTAQARQIRGVWTRLPDGSVRETAVTSTDNGITWQPWFDLVFRRHRD